MKLTVDNIITKKEITATKKQMDAKEISKGAAIRALFAGGLSVKEISKELDIRYNHVYNVVKNEVLVHGLTVEYSGRNNENSKKNQIIRLLEEGKTITEISTELKCLYNYVWQVAKGAGYTGKGKNIKTEETAEEKVEVGA